MNEMKFTDDGHPIFETTVPIKINNEYSGNFSFLPKLNIPIKLLNEYAIMPKKSTEHAAGYDLYLSSDKEIDPHTTEKLSTGISLEIPKGYYGRIAPRSSQDYLIMLAGVVDSDYRGEIFIKVHNVTDNTVITVRHGRIAQIIFEQCYDAQFQIINELTETLRGESGHSGK